MPASPATQAIRDTDLATDTLHRRLRHRLLVGFLLTSLLIGGVATYLLYRSQATRLEEGVLADAKLQALALESEISRLQNLGAQITSRSSIRERLERYDRDEISLDELVAYTAPKLEDALDLAPDMLGVTRLDTEGRPLVEVGKGIPRFLWPEGYRDNHIQLGIPAVREKQTVLAVSAPIYNRSGTKVGTDLVLFDAARIALLVRNFLESRQGRMNSHIAAGTATGVRHFLDSGNVEMSLSREQIDDEVVEALADIEENFHLVGEPDDRFVMVHRRIGRSNWVFLFFDDEHTFYAPARDQATYVGIAIVALTLVGMALTLMLVRPLAGRISVESSALRELIGQNAGLLSEARSSEARLQSILDNASAVIYLKDLEGRYLLINRRFEQIFKLTRDKVVGKTDFDLFPSDWAAYFRDNDKVVAASGEARQFSEQAPHEDGTHHYVSVKFPLFDGVGEMYAVCGISTDITEERQIVERERLRIRVLEHIAGSYPIEHTLDTIACLIEDELEGALASILVLDDARENLRVKAAPNLPDYFLESIDGLYIGPDICSCGSAAYNGETVIAERIKDHPNWEAYAELADRAGIVACWSEPVRDSAGNVQGTLAIYLPEPGGPTQADRTLMTQMAQLAGIALESKANVNALRTSEERFELAMQASNDGLWDWDLKTNHMYYSPRWKSMLGYTESELADELSTLESLMDPADRERVFTLIDECVGGNRKNFEVEFRIRHKDGHWLHLLSRAMLIRSPQSGPTRLVGTHLDITGQKHLEQQLRDSESRANLVIDMAPNAIIMTDSRGTMIRVNPQAEQLFGYAREELLGQPVEMLIPEDLAKRHRELRAAYMATPHLKKLRASGPSGHLTGIRKSGESFPLEIGLGPVSIDGEAHVVATMTDISRRVADEQSLLENEQQLEAQVFERTRELEEITAYNRTLFETSPVGLVLCDLDGHLVDANPAFLEIIGYAQHEFDQLNLVDLAPPDRRDAGQASVFQSMARAERYGPDEKVFVRKDGSRVTVRVNGLRIDQRGRSFIWSAVEDITQRKAYEKAMSDARARAEEATRAKSEFLANVSHEIRTPLNGVLGLARIGARRESDAPAETLFQRISESGQQLLRVVNDILDFSVMEAGKLKIEEHPFELAASVRQVVALAKAQATNKDIRVESGIPDSLPTWILGDALRLEQVLGNLLSNAVKFTEKGEVRLTVSASDDRVRFIVSDTGIGLDDAALEQLFKPFEQGDSSTTRRFGGTGLGLAISLDLARMMGGNINVRSEVRRGSTFTLDLPLRVAPPDTAQAAPGNDPPARRLQGLRVLSAEDIEVNRLVLADLLDAEGAHVVFAENGQETLDVLQARGTGAFDVVLMDIQMPLMDGYAATVRIREMAPGLPVIGLTAHALKEEKARCLASGMVAHVAKPVDIDTLVAAIRQHASAAPRLRAAPTSPAPRPGPARPQQAERAPVDWDALYARFDGRKAFIRKLLDSALSNYATTPDELRDVIGQTDLEKLGFISHSLKGTAGNLQAQELREIATEVNNLVKSGSNRAFTQAPALADALDAVIAELRRHLASLQAEERGMPGQPA